MPILALSSSSVTRPLTLVLQPIAVLAIVASACTNPGPKYPDLSSFCAGEANAECNSTVLQACAITTPANCLASREAACLAGQPSGTTYNAGAGEGCVNAYAAAYGDAKVTQAEMANINKACLEVFQGAGMQNATCLVDSDCKVGIGLRCVTASAGTSSCQIPQMVSGGGVCSAPNQECVAGFHCGTTGNCDIDAAVNQPCSAMVPCAQGLMCDFANTNTCLAKGADGSPCTTNDQCVNDICSIGPGQPSGICVSQIILAPMEPFCVAAQKGN